MNNHAMLDLGTFITNDFGDRYLYPVNRDAFRTVGAYTRYKTYFADELFTSQTLHILVGTDSGLLLRYLKQVGVPDGSCYLFVELPSVVNSLKNEGLLDQLDERIACIPIEQIQTVVDRFQFQNYLYTEKFNVWKSFSAIDAFLPEYAELYWGTRNFIDVFAWKIRVQMGNQIFVARQLENLSDNRIPATCLKNLFPGKTAVLLAGGPSLDDLLPWIKANRDKLVVLAVSRIARRLKQVELVPDIIFSIDPHQASFDVSKEMLFFGDKTLFVNSYHVVPKLLSQWKGPTAFVGHRFPWQDNSTETFLDAPGPTVTNTAFATAVQMGFSQIILAGVDLCFSPEGYSHAMGTYERQAGPQYNHFDTQIETNKGVKTFTSRAMAEAIAPLGDMAASAMENGCKTINPTPLAARIPHVEHTPVENIRLEPLTIPAWEHIQRALPQETSQTRIKHYKEVLGKLHLAEKDVRKIGKLAKEGLKCNDGLFGRNGMQAHFKYKIRMDKVEKTLQRPPLAAYATLIKEVGLRQFLKIARPDTSGEWSDEQIEETGRVYYKAYIDSTALLLQLIQKAIARVELRIEEETPQADISNLINAWRNHDEPGRASIWQRRFLCDNGTFSEQQDPRFVDINAEFEISLTKNAEHRTKFTKNNADPQMARHRIRILFKNRDRAALAGLLQGLSVSQNEGDKPICHLAMGYLAELDGNHAVAFEEYQQVLETAPDNVIEDALRRIASLSLELGDPHNAFLALECLTGQSPVYLSQYADLARLLGQTKTALDAYADYLEKFPNDSVVLLKVGQLYEQQGQHEFAKTVFEHLLNQDPKNEEARNALGKSVESLKS